MDQIFNFMIDKGHCININNHWCCTLGHNLKGNIIQHKLWGNKQNIINHLKSITINPFPNVVIPHKMCNENMPCVLICGLVFF